jgi:magnesium transporter
MRVFRPSIIGMRVFPEHQQRLTIMMREHQHEEKTARHLDRLLEALDSGVPSQVKKLINSLNGAEIGDLLESLPQSRRQIVWDLVKVDLDGDVLVEVNDEVRAGLIRDTAPDDLVQAMGELDLDDLADILNDLPDAVITEVLRAMDRQDRERLAQVMSYPEDSAGGLMNPDVVTVRPDVSLDVVFRWICQPGRWLSSLNTTTWFQPR